jgi:hypothetical protein
MDCCVDRMPAPSCTFRSTENDGHGGKLLCGMQLHDCDPSARSNQRYRDHGTERGTELGAKTARCRVVSHRCIREGILEEGNVPSEPTATM